MERDFVHRILNYRCTAEETVDTHRETVKALIYELHYDNKLY